MQIDELYDDKNSETNTSNTATYVNHMHIYVYVYLICYPLCCSLKEEN